MDRQEWLTYRHTGLGASEVGIILGLDDYMSSLELFYYKTGAVAKFDVENISQFLGREMEDLNATLWQYWDGTEDSMIENFRQGRIIRKCQRVNAFVRNPAYPWLYVSLDRKINKHGNRGEGTLELKNISGWESDKWAAGLPPKYVTQVNTQMAVCEFLYGEMSILQDSRRMNVLPFDISTGIVEHIIAKTKDFWERVQEGRKVVNELYQAQLTFNQRRVQELTAALDQLAPEPDGTLAYAEYLSQKFNKPNYLERRGTAEEQVEAEAQLQVAQQIKELQEEKQLHENRLKASMKDHQVLDFGPAGKVYWAISSSGRRTFRNKLNNE